MIKSPEQVTESDNTPRINVTFRRWWPVALLLIVLAFRLLVTPGVIERVYSRGLFPLLRYVWDYSMAFVPMPLFYLFWAGVLLWLWATIRGFRRGRSSREEAPATTRYRGQSSGKATTGATRYRGQSSGKATTGATRYRGRRSGVSRKEQWGRTARRVVNSLALLVTAFLLGWGMNYGRQQVTEVMGFSEYQPTLDELRTRVRAQATELAQLRLQITTDTSALTAADLPTDLEASVRPLLVQALQKHGYPTPGRPRLRQLAPKGILLRWSTAGVYWPWAGEGNIDAGLHPLQKPAVAAHELAHAYGFGDEGTCTFWGWLAGEEATDPVYRYAFGLAYWRRIAGKLRQAEPEAYWEWRAENLDPGIRNDLQAIYDNSELYQDIAPVIRDVTYDTYLKAQGIQEGLLNYGRVIRLVEGYRRRAARF